MQMIFPGCLCARGALPAGGCRCLLAWCSCPFVLRVLVVFLSLAFPPFSGDFPRNVHFLLVDARATDPSTRPFQVSLYVRSPWGSTSLHFACSTLFYVWASLRVAAGGSDGLRPLGQTFFSWRACPQGLTSHHHYSRFRSLGPVPSSSSLVFVFSLATGTQLRPQACMDDSRWQSLRLPRLGPLSLFLLQAISTSAVKTT